MDVATTSPASERLVLEGELLLVARPDPASGDPGESYDLRLDNESLVDAVREYFSCLYHGPRTESCGRVRITIERVPPIPAD